MSGTRGISRTVRELPHRKPTTGSALGSALIWLVFQLRRLPARNAHCALCALRFAWERAARFHCSCPHCTAQDFWVLNRGGLPGPIRVPVPIERHPSLMAHR